MIDWLIAGYLVWKSKFKYTCDISHQNCTISRLDIGANEACYSFLKRKQYEDIDNGGLVIPSQ